MLWANSQENGERIRPASHAVGVCPLCCGPVIAVCGNKRIWHWRHSSDAQCPFSKNETPWHRGWKNLFPEKWQEIIRYDSLTKEKHIADVMTPQGFVLEFQHSPMPEEERISREKFHKTMAWVVDCSESKRDKTRLAKNRLTTLHLLKSGMHNCYLTRFNFEKELFRNEWLNSAVPVVFDYGQEFCLGDEEFKGRVVCLFPKQVNRFGVVLIIEKQRLIKQIQDNQWTFLTDSTIYNKVFDCLRQNGDIARNSDAEIKQRVVPVAPRKKEPKGGFVSQSSCPIKEPAQPHAPVVNNATWSERTFAKAGERVRLSLSNSWKRRK